MNRRFFLERITALIGISTVAPAVRAAGKQSIELQHSPVAGFQYHHGESHPDITSIMHFTGFFIRLAGPISGAGRNEEKHYEGHEARSASSSRGSIESRPSISLGSGYSPRRQADR